MAGYKAAVIGCGNRGRDHIRAYELIDGAEVVACCAPTPTRRDAVADEFGIRAYADAKEMITTEQPDMVHIVTWPSVRVELMSLVAEMGVPLCTVEKPIATGASDWRELCTIADSATTKFAVCHQFRWHPDLVRCQDAINSGRLGAVRLVDLSAGMNISGQGTHILNYGMSLNGDSRVKRVFGAASGMSGHDSGHPAPDNTVGVLEFENGVRGVWTNGSTAPLCGQKDVFWQQKRVGAYTDLGRVEWQLFNAWEVVGPDGAQRGSCVDVDWREKDKQGQAAFHKAMFAWLEDDNCVCGTNLDQGLHEWKVVLALYASALWRRPVELADFDPPDDLFKQLAEALV